MFVAQSDQDVLVKAALTALDKVYSHLISEGGSEWLLHLPKGKGHPHDDVLHEYRQWMRSVYVSCRDQLLCLLFHPKQTVAVRLGNFFACFHLRELGQ